MVESSRRPPLDEVLTLLTFQGLVYYGVVTGVPGANQFTIPTLANLGAGKFSDATLPYYAFVFRDAAGLGAAPQGELQIITGYATGTGTFTAPGFGGGGVGAGDEILILHSRIAAAAAGGAFPALYASGTQAAVVAVEHILATAVVAGRFTLHVDTINMVAGDVLILRIYSHVLAAGVTRVAYEMTYYGAQPATELIKNSVVVYNDLAEADALRFTLSQSYGAAGRNFPWKVLRS